MVPPNTLARFCIAFLEAGWIASAILSALFMNVCTNQMFDPNKAAVIRSIAILMFVVWLIKTIEYCVLIKSSRPSEQSPESHPKHWWFKYSVLLLAGVYFLSYLISSLTSVLPVSSFWGSYNWPEGLYTITAYFVIFIMTATHLRSRAQVERLIIAIILTSLPIMAYGLIERLGWDPVPWQRVPIKRISSTMGNPIYFAAYLIMVVPLTLARLANLLKRYNKAQWVKTGFYGLVLLLQIISIILTQSRGPFLGLITGLAFFFFIYALLYKKKVLIWGLVGGLILGTIFVAIFNLPNTPLQPLKKVPYLERLGQFNPSEGSARMRIIYWENALKLMRETYQPILPHPELIDAHPWRFILGYGPETLGNIFFRHHTGELDKYEGHPVRVDNCHNSILQTFVTQGVFGLIAFLCLITGAIYLGLKTLKSASGTLNLLLLGVISAIVAHFVESLFGMKTVVTYTHFWLFLALLHTIGSLHFNGAFQHKVSGSQFLVRLLFWTYLVIYLVIMTVVTAHYQPGLETNIKVWITWIYLCILPGILLGTVSLYFNVPQSRRNVGISVVSSAFNVLGYIGLIVAAFFLIVYSNFNPILADGYYNFSHLLNNESKKIHKRYKQTKDLRNRLFQKKERISLSPDEEKQLQLTTEQTQKMLLAMFGLHLDSIVYDQHALRLVPNEKTYLNSMGRNFLELTKIWRTIKSSGWSIRIFTKAFGVIEIDMNAPGYLRGPPSIKEIMDFSAAQYQKFNQYDFFYCNLAAIKKAYEIEPTDYKNRLTMAGIYHYGAKMTRRDGKIKESDEYFKKAMEYCQEAQEASPNHPVVNKLIKTIQKEMNAK